MVAWQIINITSSITNSQIVFLLSEADYPAMTCLKACFYDQESSYKTGSSAHNRCHKETNDVTMRQMGSKEQIFTM